MFYQFLSFIIIECSYICSIFKFHNDYTIPLLIHTHTHTHTIYPQRILCTTISTIMINSLDHILAFGIQINVNSYSSLYKTQERSFGLKTQSLFYSFLRGDFYVSLPWSQIIFKKTTRIDKHTIFVYMRAWPTICWRYGHMDHILT